MDNIAVITGAGSGLGRALSVAIAARGIRVVGIGRREDALAKTQEIAGDSFGYQIADVSDAKAVAKAFSAIDAIGQITILINNAAVYPHRDILEETPASFGATMSINLGGIVNCTHEALNRMVQTGKGRIMNVSTFADVAPLPTSAAYSVSKGAARIFTRAIVADLSDRFPGIVINDWMPGMLATDMGIADGLAPETAAEWGATLALWHDPTLTGTIWEENREIPPHRGLKSRIKDKLLFQKPEIRMLDSAAS